MHHDKIVFFFTVEGKRFCNLWPLFDIFLVLCKTVQMVVLQSTSVGIRPLEI
jgi:hypothetical protein